MVKTLLLIDANALIHRAYHALPPMTSKEGKPTHALYGVASILIKIWRDERPDYAVALFDRPEPTFRKEEFKEYKEHRPKAADELVEQIIESHNLFLAFSIPVYEAPGFEADDLIGTLAGRFGSESGLTIVILTGDLDALQLVVDDKVIVKTLKTGVSSTEIYNEEAVRARYGLSPEILPDYKALVGDTSDNIPGVAGIGPKTASQLLQKYGSLKPLLDSLDNEPKYREKLKGQNENIALYRRLALIRRDAPLPPIELFSLSTKASPENLIPYFDKFGFESLKKRFFGESDKPIPSIKKSQTSPTQGLFGEKYNEPSPPHKNILILSNDSITVKNAEELSSTKTKIGFTLKELIKKARRSGIKINGPYFDLGIGFWACYPEHKQYEPEELFTKYLNKTWSGNAEDYKTAYDFIQNEISTNNLKKIFEKIEMPLLEILAEMEERGIAIDIKHLKELKSEIQTEIRSKEDSIYKIAGGKFNLNSRRELAEFLFEKLKLGGTKIKKTPKGKISTDGEVLNDLAGEHPVIPQILEYRELFKLMSTYIKPMLELCGSDGRLRTTFVQTGAATGRLSSQNPNLQNIPIGNPLADKLRKTFIPQDGFSFAAFDYSQLELRILASLSEDAKMIAAFKRGDDIHSLTASMVLSVPLEKVTPEMRRLAKTLNFGIVYGMGYKAFAKAAGIKTEEAQSFIAGYFKEFSAVRAWQERIKDEARSIGLVCNLNGRLRRVPAIRLGGSREASEAERIVLNMPIQSLGADIIKLAMIQSTRILEENNNWREGARLLLSVHDELLFEVRDDILKEVIPRIREVMESAYAQSVPLIVNVKQGKNWADLS